MCKRSFIFLMVIVAICIFLPGNGFSWEKGKILKGIFYDSPVEGLNYETQTLSGITNNKGKFEYREGETVTFSIGNFVLGSARGGERVTPADLVSRVSGDILKLKQPILTNMARFLQSLDEDGNVENGITLTERIRILVNKYADKINFNQTETAFTNDLNIKALFAELNASLRTPAQARNHLRRSMLGIKKLTDVKIPLRNGLYVLADIYQPIDEGRYPAILNLGVYGKAFIRGCICNQTDLLASEEEEDKYFEGNPENEPYENHETVNTVDWVPNGYVVVRIDGPGTCNSPGIIDVASFEESKAFYDAIEWVAGNPWSNGNVGLWGASYYALNQFGVAALQPPSLKAMIAVAGDHDSYRDTLYNGGIFNQGFMVAWWAGVKPVVCGELHAKDFVSIAVANPFYDPAIYGPTGEICISPPMDKITTPFRIEMPLEHTGHIHIHGSSEAYIQAASQHKKFAAITGDFISGWSYTKEALEDHMPIFDYWLKGKHNETINKVMHEPPVKIAVRTGGGGYFWQYEDEWPIARTQYTIYSLDNVPSQWVGDGKRNDFLKLSKTAPGSEMMVTYSAELQPGLPCYSYGVSYVTDPLPEDIEIAGYMELGMWVSSTSSDVDIFASVRVIDENNKEVPYSLSPGTGKFYPMGLGWLKVSHRKLDPEKSTIYRPYHTHLQADYAPLSSGQIVPVEVEIWPTTALIKKGHRIRLDIQPVDGCDHGLKHAYDPTYHLGALNTIYTGPGHKSYLQLPVIPPEHHRQNR